jgi:oligoribonuclease (3'-5' exoribonuclease)
MKYVSFDSETTDLKPATGQLLEFVAVVEDTEHPEIPVDRLPTYHVRFIHEQLRGNAVALLMHAKSGLLQDLTDAAVDGRFQRWVSEVHDNPATIRYLGGNMVEGAFVGLRTFLERQGFGSHEGPKPVLAGFQVGSFDKLWMPDWFKDDCHHRVIEVGSVAMGVDMTHWARTSPPASKDLGEPNHTALQDARNAILVLRRITDNYGKA